MRSATAKTSWRLCEIRTTASPCSASRAIEVEHLLRLGHAERRGGLVEDHDARVPEHGARDRDRLPLAARERGDELPHRAQRRDREALHGLGRALLHLRLVEPLEDVVRLAPEEHVLDDVEVVAEREILVHDLDSEPGRVLRTVDRDRLAVEEDLTGIRGVDAGDALDQRRLAGAVVAHEGHDLAGAHLEVDVCQGLHRAEALRDPAQLERRRFGRDCRVHGGR